MRSASICMVRSATGSTPSGAEMVIRPALTTCKARFVAPQKLASPGVSMMPMRTPSHSTKPTLVCMVVMRSSATWSSSSVWLPPSTLPSVLVTFAL